MPSEAHAPLKSMGEVGVVLYDCEHKTPPDEGSGFPYLAIPNIQGGRIDLTGVRLISEALIDEWNRRVVPKEDDIVFTRRGRVGDSAPIPKGMKCSIGQNLVILRSDGREVDQKYLRWALRGPAFEAEIQRMLNVGAVFDSLNCADIPRMRIQVPPLPEQRAIAEVLGALDDKIESNRRVAKVSVELCAALLASMETDKLPLKEVANVTMGSSPPGHTYNEHQDGLPFYQGVRDFGERFPTRRVWCTSPVRTAGVGSTLVSVRAPVGRLNRATEECCIGRGLAGIKAGRSDALVYFALRAASAAWEPFESEGTVFGAIKRGDLEDVEIDWPAADLKEEAELLIDALDERAGSALAENSQLAQLRDALLPALLSGRIRVPAAAELVEAS